MQQIIEKISTNANAAYSVGLWISLAAFIILLIASHMSLGFSSASFDCDFVALSEIALPPILIWAVEFATTKSVDTMKALYPFQAVLLLVVSIYFLITDHLGGSREYIGNFVLGTVLFLFNMPWLIGTVVYSFS